MTDAHYLSAFEYTGMYAMARVDGTEVTIKDNMGNSVLSETLQEGESVTARVKVGYTLSATEPVQVDMLAGDVGSSYEMRWYSLLPTNKWSSQYLAPVGDSIGNTTCVIYNPSASEITVNYQFGKSGSQGFFSVPAKSSMPTPTIPTDQAAYIHAESNIMVFSMTDTINKGQLFDWGYPVQPVDDLTSTVVLGWGHGCTGGDCDQHAGETEARSVVWVSPMDDAKILVDFDNDGNVDVTYDVEKFQSYKIVDSTDQDMSGAKIKARDSAGNFIKLAAAWGQDPERSFSNDRDALDLGTTVLPYEETRVSVCVILVDDVDGDGQVGAGDVCKRIQRTQNLEMDTTDDVEETVPCPTDGSVGLCKESEPSPTPAPQPTPTPAPTDEKPPAPTEPPLKGGEKGAGGGGDPHFQRWDQQRDSFHGECDLVAIHSEKFQGKGLDLHVRTTIHDWYSFIEMAALRIGEDNIELHKEFILINGVRLAGTDLPLTFGDQYLIEFEDQTIGKNANKKYYKVSLGDHSSIVFRFYKHYLTFSVAGHSDDFADANGLLGSHSTGEMVTREGDVLNDFVQFGFEWQVRPEDPVLFSETRFPQLPFEQCRMPTAAQPARRRLRGGNSKLFEQATEACASHQGNDFELCVNDVMVTGELELAYVW